jgi:hypothetical protein
MFPTWSQIKPAIPETGKLLVLNRAFPGGGRGELTLVGFANVLVPLVQLLRGLDVQLSRPGHIQLVPGHPLRYRRCPLRMSPWTVEPDGTTSWFRIG